MVTMVSADPGRLFVKQMPRYTRRIEFVVLTPGPGSSSSSSSSNSGRRSVSAIEHGILSADATIVSFNPTAAATPLTP